MTDIHKYKHTTIYSGKLWRALNLANQSSEHLYWRILKLSDLAGVSVYA